MNVVQHVETTIIVLSIKCKDQFIEAGLSSSMIKVVKVETDL